MAQTKARAAAYARWRAMVKRCTDPANPDWKYYGGRGIAVCPEWLASFQAYYDHLGDPPFAGASVDRVDNESGYFPTNVRWATPTQQVANRRYNPQSAKTHCPKNHPYDDANTYWHRGERNCRACGLEAQRRYEARRKSAPDVSPAA